MGKTKIIELTDEQRAALENGYRNGQSHAFRSRCQMVLLKSEKRTAAEITEILGGCEVVVNNWVKRFEADGINGLETRPGRGRKAILEKSDLATVRAAVIENRQRIGQAKAELERSLTKQFSTTTLKRFLKKTIAASNALEGD
jgi:transposase